jgi:hypothetical protein
MCQEIKRSSRATNSGQRLFNDCILCDSMGLSDSGALKMDDFGPRRHLPEGPPARNAAVRLFAINLLCAAPDKKSMKIRRKLPDGTPISANADSKIAR